MGRQGFIIAEGDYFGMVRSVSLRRILEPSTEPQQLALPKPLLTLISAEWMMSGLKWHEYWLRRDSGIAHGSNHARDLS